jgi:hypothetical protein
LRFQADIPPGARAPQGCVVRTLKKAGGLCGDTGDVNWMGLVLTVRVLAVVQAAARLEVV